MSNNNNDLFVIHHFQKDLKITAICKNKNQEYMNVYSVSY